MAPSTKNFLLAVACYFVCFCCSSGAESAAQADLSGLLIVVITQPNAYHVQQTEKFVAHIENQIPRSPEFHLRSPTVEISHERWPDQGAWTILPILKDIFQQYPSREWVLFCDEGTRIDLENIQKTLERYDAKKPLFIGRGLRDQEATIIHHFAFHQNPGAFVYPDLAAGFVLSRTLVRELVKRLTESKPKSDFAIDAMHELAMFIRNDGAGYLLKEDPTFCAGDEHPGCATSYPNHYPDCGELLKDDSVFFAVKTYSKFHGDRVPVVQQTWGKDTPHLVFYSDITDPEIPTESSGIPNTERGHCGKMIVILNRFHKKPELSKYDWLVIADDDTLLSVARLKSVLACYDPMEPVALGERYGYSLINPYGYDYITGGGGMVLSRRAVTLLVEECACGADDSPDDMTLGMCLKRLDIPVTHSPLFHQARPADYSERLLQHQRPVSFHKHWMIDPVSVYEQWFGAGDKQRDEL